jgi:nicotinamide riboside transporter PnuC
MVDLPAVGITESYRRGMIGAARTLSSAQQRFIRAREGLQMVRAARLVYAAFAWAFVAGILVQVYFIGLGLFSSSDYNQVHATFGWILHLAPPFILLAAALARAGRTQIIRVVILAVLIFFVPILAAIRADAPLAAAFHPVGAVLAFVLAILVARGATSLLRSSDADAATPVVEWILVAVVVLIYLALSLSGSPDA